MIDYIKNRIEAIRRSNVLDFMTEYMKKRGSELEDMGNDPLTFTGNFTIFTIRKCCKETEV